MFEIVFSLIFEDKFRLSQLANHCVIDKLFAESFFFFGGEPICFIETNSFYSTVGTKQLLPKIQVLFLSIHHSKITACLNLFLSFKNLQNSSSSQVIQSEANTVFI